MPTSFNLPPYVYVNEQDTPRVGVWDEEQQCWIDNEVDDLKFKPEERILEFNLKRFAPIAYL